MSRTSVPADAGVEPVNGQASHKVVTHVTTSQAFGQGNNGQVNNQLQKHDFDIEAIPEIQIPPRVLMGAGPSASYPEALRAMGANTLGHLDPQFVEIMNNVGKMLRRVFRTTNRITGAVPGTGTAGMEASLCNLIEQGDEVLVCVAGYFSNRMQQMARRMGAEVTVIEREWGTIFTPEEVAAALSKMHKPKVLAIVHAETSTGILQPLPEIINLAHRHGALVVVDAVTSLGGCPLLVDEWDIDVCFSGTQKCIGAPPGLSPITFSERAMDVVRNRKAPVQSWYFDMSLVETYWGDTSAGGRAYHHTAPSNALFGLHEALRMLLLEGLEKRWARHESNSRALMAGLSKLGLKPFAQEGHRLWQLNAVWVPEGIDDAEVRSRLLRRYDIEISGGLGDVKGKIWRIGTMGYSAYPHNIRTLLSALENILEDLGHPVERGACVDAAEEVYAAQDVKQELAAKAADNGQGETIGAETVARGIAHEEVEDHVEDKRDAGH
ncbi:MAG: alanine--glyoxylate aminotransferase family protein [Abitibacteriaceae bacterium]|nr:alanine--glyoxylate aminotransferase family protein [Abditibacteriaceae bacterium]MBV9866172.1 alanine--glyoxylate aminotransferase family protein [Abditibacteriaceae bacterium]